MIVCGTRNSTDQFTGRAEKFPGTNQFPIPLIGMKERLLTHRIRTAPAFRPPPFSGNWRLAYPNAAVTEPRTFKIPVASWGCHHWRKAIRFL